MPKGKVAIAEQRGWLRLRWTYQKRRYEIGISLPDTPTNRALAQQRAAIIEADMLSGQFDEALTKYREVSPWLTVVGLFEKFRDHKRREVSEPRSIEKGETGTITVANTTPTTSVLAKGFGLMMAC